MKMKPTLPEAYKRLDLVEGSDLPTVRKKFVHLYNKHKDKKKISEICAAYQRIISPEEEDDQASMNMDKMKSLIESIFSQYRQESGGNSDDDIAYISSSEDDLSDDERSNTESNHTEEGYDKVARELIADEEKRKADEKRRAEKRRAKKKKRREKKRLEKESENLTLQKQNSKSDSVNDSYNGVSRSSDEGEGLDPNAAFVKKSKKKFEPVVQHKPNIEHKSSHQKDQEQTVNESSASKKSQEIAMEGNKQAHNGDYPEAIKLFSEAIRLLPTDYRFYGNRSFCYDKTLQYNEALMDAEKSIELAPDVPKGYFRKGRALAGLKKYSDAESSFKEVLRLDKNCEEATKELYRVRVKYLIELGFSTQQAETAARANNSLRKAVDNLLLLGADRSGGDVISSGSESTDQTYSHRQTANKNTQPKNTPQIHQNGTKPTTRTQPDTLQEEKKMDPTNPEGLTALWVGNVLPSVKDTDLQQLFSRYGYVSSVRTLPEKYCAFVNFKSKDAAGKAMNALQNHEVKGQKLLIKFPDNPVANGTLSTPVPIPPVSKPVAPPVQKIPIQQQIRQNSSSLQAQKVSGPVNGDECYFWRTTGCQFGPRCRHRHVPENKGVDKKPWQRVK